MMQNNFKNLDEQNISEEDKARLEQQLGENLGAVRHIGDILGLYIGKIGSVIVGLIKTVDGEPENLPTHREEQQPNTPDNLLEGQINESPDPPGT